MTLSNLKKQTLHCFISVTRNINNLILKAKIFTDQKIKEQKNQEDKSNPFEQILKLTVLLSLCAYLYWRIFFEFFKVDYFLFFFAFEDAPYILYYKGTFHTYSLILILFFAWPYLLNLTNSYIKFFIIVTCFAILCIISVKADEFNLVQGMFLFLGILTSIVFYLLFDKKAIYGTLVLFGYFFAVSAKNDAKNALNTPLHVTLTSKDGKTILHQSEKDRFLLTATSKFYIVYDKKRMIVEKYNRDEVK